MKWLLIAGIFALVGSLTMAQARSNCDPSYPTICIPPPPPDLDCGDEEVRNFKNFVVLPPDPHHFDGDDDDGIGCELH